MKKRLASLAIMLAATGVAVSVGGVNANASTSDTLTIESVTYGDKYVATAAAYTDPYGETSTEDWINSPSASSNITSVTLSNGKTITAKDGGVLTLVVDGVEKDILDYVEFDEELVSGTYSFATTAGDVSYSEMAKFMNMGGQTAQYTYRQALKIVDGSIDKSESILDLLPNSTIASATATDGSTITTVTGGALDVDGAFFNGIYVDGSSDVIINNVDMSFDGDGANDFQGEAAAVLVSGDSTTTIKNSYIETAGVIRTAAAAKENGILQIQNSVVFASEGNDTDDEYEALVVPMMKRTPFALGLEGTIRATNILGAGQGIYSNSMIVSTGWGVLSTDSGKSGTHALDVSNVVAGIGEVEVAKSGKVYDATRTVDGVTYGYTYEEDYSGYVAYADSGVYDTFDSVEFYSPDYIQIMASNTSSAYYEDSYLYSGRIAVMTQQNNGGTISIKDSEVDVADTVVQIKSGAANVGYTDVVLDNVDIDFTEDNLYSGILVELVESDDAGNPGNTSYTIKDDGDEATVETSAGTITDSNATLKNGNYEGDIYNNIYNYTEALNVTLENANLTGVVSSSYGYHVDADGNRLEDGTVLNAYTYGDYRGEDTDAKVIGSQVNVVNEVINNPINLTIDADSVWNVTGTSYLANVALASEKSISGSATIYVQTLTVDGEAYENGTYTINGVEVVVEAAEEVDVADNGIVLEGQLYDGTPIKFIAVDTDGNYASNYVKVVGQAFSTYQFGVTVDDAYELVDIVADNGTVTDGAENSDDYGYTLVGDGSQEAITVTITIKPNAGSAGDDESTGSDEGTATSTAFSMDEGMSATVNGEEISAIANGDVVTLRVDAVEGATYEWTYTPTGGPKSGVASTISGATTNSYTVTINTEPGPNETTGIYTVYVTVGGKTTSYAASLTTGSSAAGEAPTEEAPAADSSTTETDATAGSSTNAATVTQSATDQVNTSASESASTGTEESTSVTTEFTESDIAYKVTADGEVTVKSVSSTAKKITIPATVTNGGVTYKVTAIAAKAFKSTKATKIVIGSNVSKIAAKAFKGSKATTVVLNTKNLKKANVKNALKGSKVTTISVKVGKSSVNKTYVKKYKKIFTKKIVGKSVIVK